MPFDQEIAVLATRLDRLGPEVSRSLVSSGATSAAFAAVVTVHNEYDRSSGHIGSLRSHLQLFDHTGSRVHPGFLNADSTEDLLRLCLEVGIPAAAWLNAEGPLDDEGGLSRAILEQVQGP